MKRIDFTLTITFQEATVEEEFENDNDGDLDETIPA